MKAKQKILSVLLSICMLFCITPALSFAAEGGRTITLDAEPGSFNSNPNWNYTRDITLTEEGKLPQKGEFKELPDYGGYEIIGFSTEKMTTTKPDTSGEYWLWKLVERGQRIEFGGKVPDDVNTIFPVYAMPEGKEEGFKQITYYYDWTSIGGDHGSALICTRGLGDKFTDSIIYNFNYSTRNDPANVEELFKNPNPDQEAYEEIERRLADYWKTTPIDYHGFKFYFDGWYDQPQGTEGARKLQPGEELHNGQRIYAHWHLPEAETKPDSKPQDTLDLNKEDIANAFSTGSEESLVADEMTTSPAATQPETEGNEKDKPWTDYAATGFAEGDGSKENPYQISSAEELAYLAKLANEEAKGSFGLSEADNKTAGKYYVLTKDIDLSAHLWVPIGQRLESTDKGNQYLGKFQGYFDGGNFTISGMKVDESETQCTAGLFGCINTPINDTTISNTIIKDLTISGAEVIVKPSTSTGESVSAGILCGSSARNIFENIKVSGKITTGNGPIFDGGMVGHSAYTTFKNCTVENVTIQSNSTNAYAGGFVGHSDECVFEQCEVNAAINGTTSTLGGFAGLMQASTARNCEASGSINGTWSLGGFVGYSENGTEPSVYEKCAADVEIEGSDWRLGGFAGYARGGQFDNCVALGDVSSTVTGWEPKVGGFIGESEENVTAADCHAAGTVTSESSNYKAGGFVGCYTAGIFEGCSFDNEKNSGLAAAGTGAITSGIEGGNSNEVSASIHKDYDGHTMQKTDRVEATCTTDGKEAYYACEVCKKHFEDEAGNTEITDLESYGVIKETGHTMKRTDKVEATCTTAGKEAYYTCEVCQKHFSDEVGENEITKLDEYGIIQAIGHKAGTEWKHNETSHWNECINSCGEKLNEAAHSYEWVVDKKATAAEAGSKHEECTVCGYKKAALEIPATGTTTSPDPSNPTDYKITEGENGAWEKNSDGTLTFRANGDLERFTDIQVDGDIVSKDMYTAVSGSTIITLKNEYLATLSVGKHTLTVVYDDGKASTEFEIKAADDNNPGGNNNPGTVTSPQTGDSSNLALWLALLLLSVGMMITTTVISRKKKYNR